MTERTNEVLAALASEWGVHHELMGLDDEQMEVVAIRLILETGDTPTAGALRRIARDVKRAGTEGTRSGGPASEMTLVGTGEREASTSNASVPAHRAGGGGQATASSTAESTQEPAPSPAPRRPRYLATEATTRREKDRLATVHRIEDARTGLFLAPRRPRKPLHPWTVHPACRAAQSDGARPCSRCAPLLHDSDCTCPDCDAFWEAQE